MKRAMSMACTLAVPAILLALVSSQLTCQKADRADTDAPSVDAPQSAATITATAATTLPAGPTSVRVDIMMVIQKDYGVMAHLAGERNSTATDEPYSAAKSWWDNPMVIFQDISFPNSKATAGADSASIAGYGKSSNVSVHMTLVPHADITLKSLVSSDCIKGKLTGTITTLSAYYDKKWTQVATPKDQHVVFNFDTSDKTKTLRPTTTESRTVPPFSFERYTRDRQKWEPKSAWPTKPQSGDWRCAIYVKDAKLVITGYQYVQPATSQIAR